MVNRDTDMGGARDSFPTTRHSLVAAGRLKRGGVVHHVSFDFEGAEGELRQLQISDSTDPDVYFYQEWVRSLFADAVERLRTRLEGEGKRVHFQLFSRYDLEGPDRADRLTYDDLAEEFGLPAKQVTNYLAAARRVFRSLVLERLRELCGSEREFLQEARELLGVKPS